MYVLDYLHESKDWNLTIPLYHRGHLSLRPGTTVHVAWVIRTDGDSRDAGGTAGLPELFGTTVREEAWSTVYRIWVALYDAPGVLHKVLHSVMRHGGNVLQLDSTSIERETHHNVEMVVDFASLLHTDHPVRDLSTEIEGLLLADCAQHVVAEAEGSGFFLNVRGVPSLRRMNAMLSKTRGYGPFEPVSTMQIAEKGRLELDEGIRGMLTDAGVTPPFKYLVTSDTTDRAFRITFFPATQPVVWCSIRHADMKGALESITDALQRRGITILCSLNRIQEHLGKNWFEAVLSSPEWGLTQPASEQIVPTEMVRQILEAPEMEGYELKPFFNHREANEEMQQPEGTRRAHVFALKREDVDLWLNAKEAELARVEDELLQIDSRDGYRSEPAVRRARALRSGIARVRGETARLKRRIFVSIEFTKKNEAKINAVERACRKVGLTFDVVKTPKDQPVIWQEVIERMRDTTDFFGIWTPSDKMLGSKRPSPWCVWELGVANALGINTHVFADHTADLADYKLIHGAEFYHEFTTATDFEEKVTRIVLVIAKAVGSRAHS